MRRNILIGIPVVAVAMVLGVAAAFGASRLIDNTTTGTANRNRSNLPGTTSSPFNQQPNGRNAGNGQSGSDVPNGVQPGTQGDWGWFGGSGMGQGMMWPGNQPNSQQQSNEGQIGQRITIDQAVQDAQNYATSVGVNLAVTDVLEFQNDFYAIVTEQDTGRGAFVLLVNPYSGNVTRGTNPDMRWNIKYGSMPMTNVSDNTVTLEQAKADAQKALDAQVSGAKLGSDAYSFYGYFTFNYQVNSQTAGVVSVNGVNGQVWLDGRLGAFISEKEVAK
jgi:hypothetical protein